MNISPQIISPQETDGTKEQRWMEHVTHQKESGLSRVTYCRKHQLNYHQFGYWERKYREEIASSKLVPIQLNKLTQRAPETVCTLVLNNGHELKIHDQTLLPMLLSLWG
ncbi:transposase [Legionella sp. PATHC038]|uniref:IS66 family insertion sequence element accessory protein TnpA n=1 Tax=Legionella sheltonii TaxID=2992041 RepID=UPI002243EF4A|nr:hypothetical protein [Legionella sp. PATHC038]MCW8397634.1 transposase [Legionella sp. PATHC038]MCW8398046.1 transposase [Legionella sp. PATHC038]MCW8398965.1 transposase [Legionella sp. PATHC038]MCW8398967.1 transposase [Legionella sp. PATHC038]MCW8399074.1 transposase [Legionella sp. PATHC038]